jgi:predicted PurR-regulated permease PerM
MKWMDKINRKYMQISLYTIITAIIIYSLSLVAKNAPSILSEILVGVNWLIKVVKPLILGFVFAYLMDPMVDWFENKYKKVKFNKIFRRFYAPRTWAATTSVVIIIIVVLGLISLLVFSVTNQMRLASFDDIVRIGNDFADSFKAFYEDIKDKLNNLNIQSQQFEEYITSVTEDIVNSVVYFVRSSLNSVTNISGYLTTFIFSFIIGVYFMIDGRMIIKYANKVCQAMLSQHKNEQFHGIVHDLDEVFSGYIRGQLMDALFMMFMISLVLSITGVKFAIVIGIFAGIGNLIPYFGPIVAYISTAIVGLIDGDIHTLIASFIALFIIQAIDGNLIGPKLLSRSIKIHPLIIIISLIFGSAVGGFMGMLLAVPVGAYIKMVFVRFVDKRLIHKERIKQEIMDDDEKNRKLVINKLNP